MYIVCYIRHITWELGHVQSGFHHGNTLTPYGNVFWREYFFPYIVDLCHAILKNLDGLQEVKYIQNSFFPVVLLYVCHDFHNRFRDRKANVADNVYA